MIKLKGNSRIEYRNATKEDLLEYYGEMPRGSVKAIVFFLDGLMSGIGGFKIENGSFVVFSEIKENVKVEKTSVWRCAKVVLDMVKKENIPMYAVAENKRFVEKLGFSNVAEEVYQWLS